MGSLCNNCGKDENDDCVCSVGEPESESLSLTDYMHICAMAVEIADNVTTLDAEDEERRKDIKRKAIEITQAIMSELHGSYFNEA